MRQIGVLLTILLLASSVLLGQARDAWPPSTSAALAAELVGLLQARASDSVAAADPAHEGRYVAALVYPKSQILAIAANYSVPQLMNEQLLKNSYRDAYVELNRAADRKGRLFVQDLAADGLHAIPEGGTPPDVIYRNTVDTVIFTGDWKTRSMTRQVYMETFTRADTEYADLLRIVLERLNPSQPQGQLAARRGLTSTGPSTTAHVNFSRSRCSLPFIWSTSAILPQSTRTALSARCFSRAPTYW